MMEYNLLNQMKTLKCPMSHALTEICFNTSVFGSHWQTIEEVILTLKPVYETVGIFKDTPFFSLSVVIPILLEIKHRLEEMLRPNPESKESRFCDCLHALISKKVIDLSESNLYRKATILDPRYKILYFDDNIYLNAISELAAEITKSLSTENVEAASVTAPTKEGKIL